MSVVAVVVFIVAYVLIATERIHKTLVALAGAALVVTLPVIDSDDVFYSRETGIDWDVIFLLFGMMVIVSVLRQTGVFEYIAIWAAKRARGSPLRIMILLVLVTAFASALLDNVTTVLAGRPGHAAGVRPAGNRAGAVFDGRGVRVEHRWHGDLDRRPAQHRHRQSARA